LQFYLFFGAFPGSFSPEILSRFFPNSNKITSFVFTILGLIDCCQTTLVPFPPKGITMDDCDQKDW
jgi:hypothetical protein